MRALIILLLLAIPAASWGGAMDQFTGCPGYSRCVDFLSGGSYITAGGGLSQSVSGGGQQHITLKITENEVAQKDDLYHINKKSVKFSGDVKFSGRRNKGDSGKDTQNRTRFDSNGTMYQPMGNGSYMNTETGEIIY